MPSHAISKDQAIAAGIHLSSAASLGSLLRRRRKELGYTQEFVADMLGFSPRLIGEMERGRGTVAFDRMLAYANGLGIDLAAFER